MGKKFTYVLIKFLPSNGTYANKWLTQLTPSCTMTEIFKRLRTRSTLQDLAGASALMAMLYTGLLLPGLL